MIIKPNRHNNGARLARYISSDKDGERAEVVEVYGLASENIVDAFRDIQVMADAKGIGKPFLHLSIRLPEGEILSREQWSQTKDRILSRLGLTGQPHAFAFHLDAKTGQVANAHLAVSVLDEATGKTRPLPFYALKVKALARQLEEEFDLTRVRNHREGPIRYGATRNEERQAQRLGFKKEAVRNPIRRCWDATDCGRGFDDALAEAGLILADARPRRDYVVIDPTGGLHALGERILGVSAAGIRQRLSDLDRDNLPTVEQARQFMLDLPRDLVDKLTRELAEVQKQIEAQMEAEREYAERDPAREEIQWLDEVAEAAIEKEKIERQFVEPRPAPAGPAREEEARGAAHREITTPESEKLAAIIAEGQKRQAAEQERQAAKTPKPKPAAPELGRVDAGIRLAYSLTGTGQEFADALEDREVIAARMTEADAARLNRWERQRLKELEALAPAPAAEKLSKDEMRFLRKLGQNSQAQQQAAGKNDLTRADAWMAQTGGFENLPPDLREKAEASYEKWGGPKEKYGLKNYVDYVQTREAERREKEQTGQQRPYEKYKAGELVVVDPWGGVHQLNYRNTGARPEERAERLRDIDTAPLMSVADAENVMKNLSAHRQEERRQIWEQKRQEFQRAAQERHWPTLPAQPEHKSAVLFNQAATEATRDERTENLTGPAAQVFEAWRQTGSDKAKAAELAALYGNKSVSLRSPTKEDFAAMLDDRGITFARVDKHEANRSHKEADLARAADNYAPRFREGEIVIVTEARLEFNSEPRRRVYKLDQSIAEKFVTRLNIADRLQNIETTLKASDERQQLRRDERATERTERATGIQHGTTRGAQAASFMAQTAKAQVKIMDAAPRAVNAAFNIGVELAGLFFSAFDTPKSPRQQARDNFEGERLTDRRNAEAEVKIDFSRYTGERAQEQRNEQQEEAARDRERGR